MPIFEDTDEFKQALALNEKLQAAKIKFAELVSIALVDAEKDGLPVHLAKGVVMFQVNELSETFKKIVGPRYVGIVESFNEFYDRNKTATKADEPIEKPDEFNQ